MGLSFRQLEVLRAVARHGAVTAAASDLRVSQPAVSMMLRECAAAAGFPLFMRRQGRLQPTPELRVFLDDIERVFSGVERINRLVEDMRDASVGSVVVAVTPALADSLLPPAIAAFRRTRPRIQVTVQAMDNIAVVETVMQGSVDFGLVLTPIADVDARLVPLCAGELVCIVHPDSPLAGRHTVEPRDLAPYPLISFSSSLPLGSLVERSFHEAGVPRRIALEVNQSSVALALVRAGVGVAVVDPFLLMGERETGILRLRLRPQVIVEAQALVPREGSLSRPARMLLAATRRVGSALMGEAPLPARGSQGPALPTPLRHGHGERPLPRNPEGAGT
jgi:DNA-binding transcriptional LysR family regulator